MQKPIPKKRTRTIKRKPNADGMVPHTETLEQFLARGGKITKCPPKNADMCIPGSTYIDGGVFITAIGEQEYIPNYVVSEPTYAAAQNDRPDILLASAWREKEIESLPLAIREVATSRKADADEWNGDELLNNYFDEIEPEEVHV